MLYVFVAQDIENSLENRKSARPAHLARLKELDDAGRLVLAGPMPAIDSADPGEAGFTGSVVVAEFNTIEDAQAWADDEPYIAAGAYESVMVKPFIKVLPK